jgi:hypothetical protein
MTDLTEKTEAHEKTKSEVMFKSYRKKKIETKPKEYSNYYLIN